jgi:hypothetical protein
MPNVILHVAAVLAAMSESSGGGGPGGDPRDEELARLREENARLRGGDERQRAADEQALRGRAEPETDESRRMRAEEEGRRRQEEESGGEKKRLTGDDALRELTRILQGSVVFHQASSETAQADLDRLRVGLGDEEHEAHVALRDYHRAINNHNAHPATPAGNIAHAAEVERATKALEANPLAKRRLAAIEKARRMGAPVDFTAEENEGATR